MLIDNSHAFGIFLGFLDLAFWSSAVWKASRAGKATNFGLGPRAVYSRADAPIVFHMLLIVYALLGLIGAAMMTVLLLDAYGVMPRTH